MELPLYATVLASLASGAVGAALTQWLAGRRERATAKLRLAQDRLAALVHLRAELAEYLEQLFDLNHAGERELANGVKWKAMHRAHAVLRVAVPQLIEGDGTEALWRLIYRLDRLIESVEEHLGMLDGLPKLTRDDLDRLMANLKTDVSADDPTEASPSPGRRLVAPLAQWLDRIQAMLRARAFAQRVRRQAASSLGGHIDDRPRACRSRIEGK